MAVSPITVNRCTLFRQLIQQPFCQAGRRQVAASITVVHPVSVWEEMPYRPIKASQAFKVNKHV